MPLSILVQFQQTPENESPVIFILFKDSQKTIRCIISRSWRLPEQVCLEEKSA